MTAPDQTVSYGCCEHCADDPIYHEDPDNSVDGHTTWCTLPGCTEGRRVFRKTTQKEES